MKIYIHGHNDIELHFTAEELLRLYYYLPITPETTFPSSSDEPWYSVQRGIQVAMLNLAKINPDVNKELLAYFSK